MSNIDNFEINFGNAKTLEPFTLPPDGNYLLEIVDYEVKPPKKAESQGKGFVIFVKFAFVDPPAEVSEDYRIHHVIWFDVENPWGAKPFFEALVGTELNGDEVDPRIASNFIGEKVGAVLVKTSYEVNGQTRYKMEPESFYSEPY